MLTISHGFIRLLSGSWELSSSGMIWGSYATIMRICLYNRALNCLDVPYYFWEGKFLMLTAKSVI